MTAPNYLLSMATLFQGVQQQVNLERQLQGLAPLVNPYGSPGFLFGQEWLQQEHDAPRVVIVPTGGGFVLRARMSQTQAVTGKRSDINPKVFRTWRQTFEAHLWGDEVPGSALSTPPTVAELVSGFDACQELQRELMNGLRIYAGNMPNLEFERSEYRQPTDNVRRGRLLVLHFAVEVPVSTLPAIPLSYSSVPVPGSTFQVAATVEAVFPNGSSSVGGTIIAPFE